jgi:epoxyqueuosine reductase
LADGRALLDRMTATAAAAGFNLVGAGDVARFDERSPAGYRLTEAVDLAEPRTVVMIGSGGPGFWRTFKQTPTTAEPDELRRADGSIDAYSTMVVPRLAQIVAAEGARCEVFYPFGRPGHSVSFRRLAEHCGFGVAGTVLGTVIHPEFGPWVSLRGALVTDLELPETGEIEGYEPCEGCAQPCVTACPIGTYDSGTWDFAACVRYRLFEDGCPTGCLSRLACVVGPDQRYSDEEYGYRHEFTAAARENLARIYG